MSQPNPALLRKIRKVLEMSTEEGNWPQALDALGEIYPVNNLAARRMLRGRMERRVLDVNQEFLLAFGLVQERLDVLQHSVDEMAQGCDSIADRLASTQATTSDLTERANVLTNDRRNAEAKGVIADGLLSRFQLTPEEEAALRAQPLDSDFFKALNRLESIKDDCRTLLRSGHQRAGLEILDATSRHQEIAFERLYRWTRSECGAFAQIEPELSPLLRLAFASLSHRPLLLANASDEVLSIRRSALMRSFVDALTRGGPGGQPRPIDVRAHDALRYVGDMLAWLHQSVASETELLSGLFDAELKDATSRSLEGLCRPLRTRVEQAIAAPSTDNATLMRLANLLSFYERTFVGLLGQDTPLVITIRSLHEACMTAFVAVASAQGDRWIASPPAPPSDLSPPLVIEEAVVRASHVLEACNHQEQSSEFSPFLRALLDPIIRTCALSASSLRPSDMAVFLLNCLGLVLATLLPYSSFTSAYIEGLQGQIEAHLSTLVQEQASILSLKCSLSQKLALVQSDSPLGSDDSLRASFASIQTTLFDVGSLAMPQCERLIDPAMRETARMRVAAVLADAYSTLYKAVGDRAAVVASISPQEANVLLGLSEKF